jgi:serine/threonine protein phosphatase PrpC
MSITGHKPLELGDVMLVCTDGFWSGLDDEQVARLGTGDGTLAEDLRALSEIAVLTNEPHSDNTSAAVLRWVG